MIRTPVPTTPFARTLPLWILCLGVLAGLAGQAQPAQAQTKLLRFPDVGGDMVVFVYGGDLWRAPAEGGLARRLTAHPGVEVFPRISPDGRWIAFTGQYDGDEQVYVIPAEGGEPRQLTFYPARGPLPPRWGYDHQVYGWTPDGSRVLFRSHRDRWDISESRLYTVPLEGGLPQALPMPTSGAGAFSPDGRRMVYSPLARDFRTWKRYRGGWAQDLYLFDLEGLSATRITDYSGTDRDPMWIGGRIYFTSDRDGTLNLYAYDPGTGATEQITHSTEWDVRWPGDDGEGRIVYELGGELQVLDLATGASRPIAIQVPDDGLARRPSRVSAADTIEGFGLSPKGERALFVARGDVFTAPIEHGVTRNLTRSSGAHDKWAAWSPDGSEIAFLSDRDGEEELYLVAQDGSGELRQLTDGGRAMRYNPVWSPDGERIAFSDKDGKIYVVTVADGAVVEVADDPRGLAGVYAWSPRGGFLAYTLSEASGFASLHIWSVETGRSQRVTGEEINEFDLAWDPSGDYLYFLADRGYPPQIGSFEWNYVVDRETYLYAMALRRDVPHPYPPRNDEVTLGEDGQDGSEEGAAAGAEGEGGKEEEGYIRIDFDGLADRVARVPVEADNYVGLAAVEGHLLYVVAPPFYYGRPSYSQPSLHIFSHEKREEKVLAEGIAGYQVSADGTELLVQQGGSYKLYGASWGGDADVKAVSTEGLAVDRVPAEEWAQIFDEVWRRFRDWFYVANLHGYDWEALKEQYRPLLAHVAHRSDLNYLLGEMIAELNVSHAYLAGGDYQVPERPGVALPGARFELDAASGRYRIASIFAGENEEETYRSPLAEVGIDATEGLYVLAVDGEELTAPDNPYRLLRHKVDQAVTLTVNDRPGAEGAREITFEPIASEDDLIYLDWVTRNALKVQEASGGRVGYLHLPDMGAAGLREFIKHFYGQIRKEGLIVDVRGNGGGNVSQMIIERLRRTLLGLDFSRNDEHAGTYPAVVFTGHLVCLLSETSASDGDIFPYMFREAGLGPLIGKRSWGGVVGISGRGPLIDGGQVFVPETGTASADGRWVIEGRGVEPDIEVDNDPASVIRGEDRQLDRAIQEILQRVEEDPRVLAPRPADPVRTRDHYDGVEG